MAYLKFSVIHKSFFINPFSRKLVDQIITEKKSLYLLRLRIGYNYNYPGYKCGFL